MTCSCGKLSLHQLMIAAALTVIPFVVFLGAGIKMFDGMQTLALKQRKIVNIGQVLSFVSLMSILFFLGSWGVLFLAPDGDCGCGCQQQNQKQTQQLVALPPPQAVIRDFKDVGEAAKELPHGSLVAQEARSATDVRQESW